MIELQPLPAKEAIEFFRQKGFALSFDHRDFWQAQHQSAFTVAKVMQQDILNDIRQAVDKALTEGIPYEQFAKTLTPTLQAKGWWGRKVMKDPLTGETNDVQLGSPNRLKVIYDTNLRTAHSEGQWERIQENKDAFPYLQYDGNNSEHPRLEHSGWDGLVLHVDDPFWLEHIPVKKYRCKCRVFSLTAHDVERSGLKIDQAPEVPKVTYVNQRTGEVQQIPVGVDPSFHYPPGGRRASLNKHLVEKLEAATPEMARASVTDLVRGQGFAEWYNKPAGTFPVAYLDKPVAERLGAKTQQVVLSDYTLTKQQANHPELTISEYGKVQEAIDRGVQYAGNAKNTWLYILEEDDGYVVVIKVTRDASEIFMTSMRRLSNDQARRDKTIQDLLKLKK